uniref:Uncharacterized protein n=1 Tax=Solanum lycopersicum TaxID=4081 RepID=A0A3Q7FB38_SOLLC
MLSSRADGYSHKLIDAEIRGCNYVWSCIITFIMFSHVEELKETSLCSQNCISGNICVGTVFDVCNCTQHYCATSLDGCLANCIVDVNWKSKNSAHLVYLQKMISWTTNSGLQLDPVINQTACQVQDGKSLYLRIDDCCQNICTTGDDSLFVMSFTTSSLKEANALQRVLHSLKESLLRIALVYPSVSFKSVDIESEDDLLCTRASPSLSPLPL